LNPSAIFAAVLAASSLFTSLVNSAVKERMASTGAPGVSVAIVRAGRIVYAQGFGVGRLGGRTVDPDTRFEIGSLTKQFTAAAILQLKERRKLSLDDRLAKFVPQFPHAREITLRQLLNQTSGLPDFMTVNHFLHISHSTPGGFSKIERMASGPLHFMPGSHWEYSNTNYIVLGRVVEIASAQPYDTYVRDHVFTPAAMRQSSTIAGERALKRATGYWRGLQMKGALRPAPSTLESWTWSAGDIVSTAGDIARWDIALESGKIISKADFQLMTTPARLSSGKIDDYGFHWWTDPQQGHRLFSGLGDTYGFSSANDIFPDDDIAIIVLENMAVNPDGSSDAAEGIAEAIFKAIQL